MTLGHGVWVESVGAESPAEQAGLVSGDIIIEINGRIVNSHYEVSDWSGVAEGYERGRGDDIT